MRFADATPAARRPDGAAYATDAASWLACPPLGVTGAERAAPAGAAPASTSPAADAFFVHGTLEGAGGNVDARSTMAARTKGYARPSGNLARRSWRYSGLQEDDVRSPTLQEVSKAIFVSPSSVGVGTC